jgi:hypothetical protein
MVSASEHLGRVVESGKVVVFKELFSFICVCLKWLPSYTPAGFDLTTQDLQEETTTLNLPA